MNGDSRCFGGGDLSPQWMIGIDCIVAIRTDQQQVPDVGMVRDMFNEIERCGVCPLKIVDKERQGGLSVANTCMRSRNTP